MDLRHLVSTDHANIRQVADQIRRAVGSDGPTGRDKLFEQFDDELRRHMMLMDDVVLPAARRAGGGEAGRDMSAAHHDLMRRLDALATGNRSGAEWTGRFEAFTDELDRMFGEHVRIAGALPDTEAVARAYERAKLRSLRGASRAKGGWLLGLGLGLAAAAVATAAWRRRSGGTSLAATPPGDIASPRRRMRVRAVAVRPAPVAPAVTL